MAEASGIRAVFWDFGGVITSSPFEAFNRFETERGLPRDFISRVNSTNADANAWAKLERSQVDAGGFTPRSSPRRARRVAQAGKVAANTAGAPSRSWMSAPWTTTATSRPPVSVRM